MHHVEAVFVKGIVGSDPILEDGKPQIAFFGRSNVGKSSVINSLLHTKYLVKTSSTPGRTQQINLFLIDRSLYFIDVPGYGYARLPGHIREKIAKHMEWYVTRAHRPTCAVLIIDAKVGPTKHDVEAMDLLTRNNHSVILIANKADQISMTARTSQAEKICATLHVSEFQWYSAKTHEGRDTLFRRLFEMCRS